MNVPSDNGRQFTGWHMVAVMVAFFGIIIGVNVTMAVFAATSWTGLITKDSYLAGQSYNEEMEKARRQDALGLVGALTLSASQVEFEFRDADGNPVIAESIEVSLGRPADNAEDHRVALAYEGAGVYRAADTLGAGQWQAELKATLADGTNWRKLWRLHVKADGEK